MRENEMNNTCIICDEIVPEGRQICPACEDTLKNLKVKMTKPKKKRRGISAPFVQLTIDDMEKDQWMN